MRLIGHHTGISLGFYGTSHHATEDIGTMRSIAGLDHAPADGPPLAAAIKASATWTSRSISASAEAVTPSSTTGRDVRIRQGDRARPGQGADDHRLRHGRCMGARSCRKLCAAEGKSVGVIDMAIDEAFDRAAMLRAASRSKAHDLGGGAQRDGRPRSAMAEVLADEGAGVRFCGTASSTSTASSPRRCISMRITSWTRRG